MQNMNRSLVNATRLRDKPLVAHRAFCMWANQNRRIRVTFTKKDGSVREMVCIPRQEYNQLIAKPTTEIGRRIVAAKSRLGMIVVAELISTPEGLPSFQPRTINLNTLISMELL